MMEDELPQEEDNERCGNAVLGKRKSVRGDKEEECVVEEVCWRNQGSNASQKKKKDKRIIKGRRRVERPEVQMTAWKGETKYFHFHFLESNDDVVQDEKGDDDKRRREEDECEGESRDEYDYVHIMVKDSGRGIPANLLATIFDPFVQV